LAFILVLDFWAVLVVSIAVTVAGIKCRREKGTRCGGNANSGAVPATVSGERLSEMPLGKSLGRPDNRI